MKYGSRWYIKGVPKSKVKLIGHMVHRLEENAKRPQKGQGVAAATKEEGKNVGVYMQAMITRLVGWKQKLVSVAISC